VAHLAEAVHSYGGRERSHGVKAAGSQALPRVPETGRDGQGAGDRFDSLERETETLSQWQQTYPTEPPIMVFVKHFDVEEQTLTGLGHFYVHRHLKVVDLANMINDVMKFPPGTALKIYEVRYTQLPADEAEA
jgi:hypothetical protein